MDAKSRKVKEVGRSMGRKGDGSALPTFQLCCLLLCVLGNLSPSLILALGYKEHERS